MDSRNANASRLNESTLTLARQIMTELENVCRKIESLLMMALANETMFVRNNQRYHDILSDEIQKRRDTTVKPSGEIVIPGCSLYETLKSKAKTFATSRLKVANSLMAEYDVVNSIAVRITCLELDNTSEAEIRRVSLHDQMCKKLLILVEEKLRKIIRLRNALLYSFITPYMDERKTDRFNKKITKVLDSYAELACTIAATH